MPSGQFHCSRSLPSKKDLKVDIAANAADVKDTAFAGQLEPTARSWKDFAALINGAWRRSAEAFIQVGQYLIEAKEELDRDEFEALLKLRLDFDASVARRLMCIAGDRELCAHAHKLPACWTTIYELTKLDGPGGGDS
jgi:hypothetical protein